MLENIREHKHVLFCADGINALGVVRCLGEVGIWPILIEEKYCEGLVRHSKYIAERHQADSWDAALDFMLEHTMAARSRSHSSIAAMMALRLSWIRIMTC